MLLAPLVLVQPALAAGLLVLMVLAQRMLGEHCRALRAPRDAAIVVGVVGAGLTAPPRTSSHGSEDLAITFVLVVSASRACCRTCCGCSHVILPQR